MNPLDEYDQGETARDQRRMTVRWKANSRNVMTDDGPEEMALHIATFASPSVAQHITDLHNRTLGEGQDPPRLYSGASPAAVNEMLRNAHADGTIFSDPGLREPPPVLSTSEEPTVPLVDDTDARRWAAEFMQLRKTTELDEGAMLSWFANAIETGRRAGQREPRRPTSRTLVHIDVLQGVAETVQRLVDQRVAEYAAREPARIVIDGNPTAMANMLTKLGWFVRSPESQDVEPGSDERMSAVLADTENLIRLIEQRGYQVSLKVEAE